MKQVLFATAMIVAGSLTVFGPAVAADLEDSYDRSDRAGSPYDDPRYAEIYGRRDRARDLPREAEPFQNYSRYNNGKIDHSTHDHADNRCVIEPRSNSYKDDDGYSRRNSGRRYSSSRNCLSKSVIRTKLRDDGWHAFELIKVRKHTGVLKARYADGNKYRISVDRCTGKILRTRLLRRYRGDTYAYRNNRRYRAN